MPTDVLFIHSAGAQSGNQGSAPFVKSLRHALGGAFRVTAPEMPAPTKPSYERWRSKLDKLLPNGKSPPILVGHSLGGSVLLKYLSESPLKVQAAGLFLVATPFWGHQGWDVSEFVLRDGFAAELPGPMAIHLYQSRDDDVVDFNHLARHAQALPQAVCHTVDTGGHVFAKGLPELVDDMRRLTEALATGAHAGLPSH